MGLSFTERFIKPTWLAAITGLLGIMLYVNAIPNYYAIDDGAVITANPYVQQGLSGIKGVFTDDTWTAGDAESDLYRPLALVTFATEHQLWGDNPHASHFINALLYALTGVLLCLLLIRIFNRYHILFAFAVSLLFIAHPIHTEVVANIKSRDELMQFLFFMVALYCVLRSGTDNLKWLLAGCAFFYLSLLSKESGLAGLLLLPAILYFATGSSPKQIAKTTAIFAVVVVLFFIQKKLALGNVYREVATDPVSLPYADTGLQLPTAFNHMWHYIKLLVIPYPLSYNYTYNQIPATGWSNIMTLAGVCWVIVASLFVLYRANKKDVSALGIYIIIAALAPGIGYELIKGGMFAERFLYVPALGFCILLGWSLFVALGLPLLPGDKLKKQAIFKWAALVIILLLYSFVTVTRNPDWKDDLSISSHDVLVTPNSCQARLHYGKKLIDLGVAETDERKKEEFFYEGVQQLHKAIAINPKYARAYFKLGYAYQVLQPNTDSAIYYYRRAIDEAPGYAIAYKNLGLQYAAIGRTQQAEQYLQKALQIEPGISGVADVLNKLNSQPAPPAIAADTNSFGYYSTTGVALAKEKKLEQALGNFQKALSMQPESLEALVNIATCYGMMNNYAKSEEYLLKAEKIQPGSRIVLQNLVILYRITGNKIKEQEYLKKANP